MITSEQIDFFNREGYLHVPAAIGPIEIDRLRSAVDELSSPETPLGNDIAQDMKYGALVGDKIETGDILCRIEYSLDKNRAFLQLLGHPLILTCAALLHQEAPIVLTWEDIIIKSPERGFPVPFHQDLLYQSTKATVFSIGVYFDDSDCDPLLALPGTQRLGPLSDDAISNIVLEKQNEIVTIPVRAGDLLIHNVLMIHGSGYNTGAKSRRVLYFEFRTPEQVLSDSPWDERWLAERNQYISAAVKARGEDPVLLMEDARLTDTNLDNLAGCWHVDGVTGDHNIQWRVPHDPEETWVRN